MANDILNLAAEAGRNIIDDDAEPALILQNTNASGTALNLVASTSGGVGLNVDVTGTGAGVDADVTGTGIAGDFASSGGKAVVGRSAASAAYVADFSHSVVASPTVAPVLVGTSAASGALFEFNVGLISSASIAVRTAFFPVKSTAEDKIVYLAGYEIV